MESKLPCPRHGQRYIKIQEFGPVDHRRGEWHKCTRCDFRHWIQFNAFVIAASAASLAIYTENVIRYLRLV